MRRRPLLVRYWWATLVGVAGIATAAWFVYRMPFMLKRATPLPGYESRIATLEQEYLKFNGRALREASVRTQFQQAAELTSNAEYNGALLLLDTVAKKAALPVVFNDMGMVYAQLGDRVRAIQSFREALARDFDYAPVRQNLARLPGFAPNAADPVSTEVEPNNSNDVANVIALNKPVQAEIADMDNDNDVFRVISPAAPRDLLEVHLENHSQTLAPRLSVYDEDGTILPWGKDQDRPGGSFTQIMSPKPNSPLYLHIYGHEASSGAYTLTVKALRAFDAYEPNDDIYHPTKLHVGQAIEANIMDADDTDFYSFVSPRTGTVAIEVSARTNSLIPGLDTFGPDMRSIGFGPNVKAPGAPLHHTMEVQEGATYFLQVFSLEKTSGDYGLKIE